MTRLVSFVSAVLLIAALPDVLAGPACPKKHYERTDCISECNYGWGRSGRAAGRDRWDAVVNKMPSNETMDDVHRNICGYEPSRTHHHHHPVDTVEHHVFPASTKSSTAATPPSFTNTQSAAPTTTAASSSSTGSPTGGSSSSDTDAYLSAHNTVRAAHGAAPVTWSSDLASKAQTWANKCIFEHSKGFLGPYGENLAAGTGSSYGIQAAIGSWSAEASEYNPSRPVYSHFTQMVWKSTTQLGCAVQLCDGIFSSSYGKAKFYVCEYSPAGNIIGEFDQNVQA